MLFKTLTVSCAAFSLAVMAHYDQLAGSLDKGLSVSRNSHMNLPPNSMHVQKPYVNNIF